MPAMKPWTMAPTPMWYVGKPSGEELADVQDGGPQQRDDRRQRELGVRRRARAAVFSRRALRRT